MNVRWTVRQLRQRLRELGCHFDRFSGSHEVWKLPDGVSLPPLVGNHANDVIHVKNLRKFLRHRGIDLDQA